MNPNLTIKSKDIFRVQQNEQESNQLSHRDSQTEMIPTLSQEEIDEIRKTVDSKNVDMKIREAFRKKIENSKKR